MNVRKRNFALVVIIFTFVAVNRQGLCRQCPWADDYFPLKKGNSWTYSALVDWTVPDSAGEVQHDEITWDCEVVDIFCKGNILAARLRGFLYDLTWYEKGKAAGDYIVIRVGASHYHLISDKVEDFWRKVTATEGYSSIDELGADNLLLEVPLIVGETYGEFADTPRGSYCWNVTKESSLDVSSIAGVGQNQLWKEFSVRFQTGPDHTVIGFTPGLGITHFEYGHHGTVANCRARLVQFHTGG